MFDLLIKNAMVIDGQNRPAFQADVAVNGDEIAAVGNLGPASAGREIDAAGLALAPGFIDMHSHADYTLPACPTADSLLQQGVTTAVVGQCGFSLAPLLPHSRQEVIGSLETRRLPVPWEAWGDFASYLDHMDRSAGLAVNMVPLVGQGTIRAGVMGVGPGRADAEQMARMRAEAERALAAGAFGLSTGLIYPPGSYAPPEEIVELTEAVGAAGGMYFSHIRGEGDTLLQAVAEAVEIGRRTGAAVEIAHFKAGWPSNWAKQAPALELIERARDEGLDVSADVYPYLAGATSLKSVLPDWAQEGGKPAILARLADPAQRERVKLAMNQDGFCRDGAWDKIMVSRAAGRPQYSGRFVAEAAQAAGLAPEEWVCRALEETDLDTGMIAFMISEENMRQAIARPYVMIGSDSYSIPVDGPLAQGSPHPRTFGTFARVIGRLVREEKVLTLTEAVHKMTGLTATKLGLADRGSVKAGCRADLVLLDPAAVADRADYLDPFHYAVGVARVFVNGREVLTEGKPTGARPGRVLRR